MKSDLKLKLKRHRISIYQIIITIFAFVMTIVMPAFSYFNFKILLNQVNCSNCSNLASQVNLGGLEATYDILIYFLIILGIVISFCTYFIFNHQKYSLKRGTLLLAVSIMYLISTIALSKLSIIFVEVEKVQIITDFSGVYILLIIIMFGYIIKNLFDLIDFKINQLYYSTFLRKARANSFIKRNIKGKLTKCPKCKYMCRIRWKKCPICEAKI